MLNKLVDMLESKDNITPLKKRLKALTKLFIVESMEELAPQIITYYNALINEYNYNEEMLKAEMGIFKEKCIAEKELNDLCENIAFFPINI
jgi:hypothetical protein